MITTTKQTLSKEKQEEEKSITYMSKYYGNK